MDSEIGSELVVGKNRVRQGTGKHNKREGKWLGASALVVAGAMLSLLLAVTVNAQDSQPQDQSQQQSQGAQAQSAEQSPDQGQQGNAQQPPADQSQPQAAQPPAKAKPKYYPQDANRPPYNNDRDQSPYTAPPPSEYGQDAQGTPEEQQGPDMQGQEGQAPPPPPQYRGRATRPPGAGYANQRPAAPLPATLTIPAGTVLSVRLNEFVSSDKNQVGDRVTATLERPIVVNGWVVARRGQVLTGQVTAAVKAGRIKGTSQLGLEFTDLALVDGQSAPILTEIWKGSGGTSHGADAATIGGTTALGAAIGAAADWGRGAAIGAGAGAAAGIGAVLLTRGRPTEILPETPLTFRLVDPVKVDTTQGAQAFAPVTQQDYDGGHGDRRDRRYAGAYPAPPPPCSYYGPCYAYPAYPYAYPYPYVGFYGGWGWHRGWWR
jgi:type II secretory pathway pseudopilin PulG